MLHLARGDAPAAVRVLRKRIGAAEGDLLALAPPFWRFGSGPGRAAFAASAALAAATAACAKEEDPEAADGFEEAIHAYESVGMPLPAAQARLALACCLAGKDDRAAREECRAAVAVFEHLGAKRDLDAAANLRRSLGLGARVGPRTTSKLTRREKEENARSGSHRSEATHWAIVAL